MKPENLLLDAKHEIVKITDFGIAHIVKSPGEKEVKLVKGVAGSDPYISPEQWNEEKEYDALKADVWSCGKLFFIKLFQKKF